MLTVKLVFNSVGLSETKPNGSSPLLDIEHVYVTLQLRCIFFVSIYIENVTL